jgi:hypothetical protein
VWKLLIGTVLYVHVLSLKEYLEVSSGIICCEAPFDMHN